MPFKVIQGYQFQY